MPKMSVGDPCYGGKQKRERGVASGVIILLNRLIRGGANEKIQLCKD